MQNQDESPRTTFNLISRYMLMGIYLEGRDRLNLKIGAEEKGAGGGIWRQGRRRPEINGGES